MIKYSVIQKNAQVNYAYQILILYTCQEVRLFSLSHRLIEFVWTFSSNDMNLLEKIFLSKVLRLFPIIISSVRSSYSHPDLLVTQHPTTFSDHTGPQHWTFTFWATTAKSKAITGLICWLHVYLMCKIVQDSARFYTRKVNFHATSGIPNSSSYCCYPPDDHLQEAGLSGSSFARGRPLITKNCFFWGA